MNTMLRILLFSMSAFSFSTQSANMPITKQTHRETPIFLFKDNQLRIIYPCGKEVNISAIAQSSSTYHVDNQATTGLVNIIDKDGNFDDKDMQKKFPRLKKALYHQEFRKDATSDIYISSGKKAHGKIFNDLSIIHVKRHTDDITGVYRNLCNTIVRTNLTTVVLPIIGYKSSVIPLNKSLPEIFTTILTFFTTCPPPEQLTNLIFACEIKKAKEYFDKTLEAFINNEHA